MLYKEHNQSHASFNFYHHYYTIKTLQSSHAQTGLLRSELKRRLLHVFLTTHMQYTSFTKICEAVYNACNVSLYIMCSIVAHA